MNQRAFLGPAVVAMGAVSITGVAVAEKRNRIPSWRDNALVEL